LTAPPSCEDIIMGDMGCTGEGVYVILIII
jgi:hypothetical protein